MNYRTSTFSEREALISAMVEGIRSKMDIGVLGVSGGADSTLVAILACMALGHPNVYAVSMPFGSTDAATFNARSTALADRLRVNHETISIAETAQDFFKAVSPLTPLSGLQGGNIRSRCRMVILYAKCGTLGETYPALRARVLGTGNLSEDFIGFDTKGGDALADYFPIGGLYKQEVYDLLDHFKAMGVITEDLIDRIPSAGLWEGQTDEGELGHSYNEMAPAVQWLHSLLVDPGGISDEDIFNKIIKGQVEGSVPPPEGTTWDLVHFVWNRYVTNRHKHVGPEVCALPSL